MVLVGEGINSSYLYWILLQKNKHWGLLCLNYCIEERCTNRSLVTFLSYQLGGELGHHDPLMLLLMSNKLWVHFGQVIFVVSKILSTTSRSKGNMFVPLTKIYVFLGNDYTLLYIALFSLSRTYADTITAVQLAVVLLKCWSLVRTSLFSSRIFTT